MFLIAGLRTRHTTLDTGTFHCPSEGGERRYRHLQARRWFTLFFIPLIPLGQRRDLAHCLGCGATYTGDVLTRHPSAQR